MDMPQQIQAKSVPLESQPDSQLTLLMLDDQADILKSLTRVLRKEYRLVSFTQAEQAIAYLERHAVQLILSDMRMPGVNGATFLAKAKQLQPQAVRLLLTGYSETDAAIAAINQGGIHTYLSKPWDNQALKLSLHKAAEFYRLQQQRNALLETLGERNQRLAESHRQLEQKVSQRTQHLRTTNLRLESLLDEHRSLYRELLALLSFAVGAKNGKPVDSPSRLAGLVKVLALQLGLTEREARSLQVSARLHNVGLLVMDRDSRQCCDPASDILQKQRSRLHVRPEKQRRFAVVKQTLGMLKHLKRFQPHLKVVQHQDENFDGSGEPLHLKGSEIPIGSRIIRVVRDFDSLITGHAERLAISPAKARAMLQQGAGSCYDPQVVAAFLSLQQHRPQMETSKLEYCVGVEELQPGQSLMRDLILANGKTMLKSGAILSAAVIERIRRYAEKQNEAMVISIRE